MKLPKRKIIRLQNYDYSQSGYYFVTICSAHKECIFGEIITDQEAKIYPTAIGKIVIDCWNKIDQNYTNVSTDDFCLMPNHIHGIIIIKDRSNTEKITLHKIIQGFKSITTRMCFKYGRKTIWQRSYYEHIIRNEYDLYEIRKYIQNNPAKWIEDKYYKDG